MGESFFLEQRDFRDKTGKELMSGPADIKKDKKERGVTASPVAFQSAFPARLFPSYLSGNAFKRKVTLLRTLFEAVLTKASLSFRWYFKVFGLKHGRNAFLKPLTEHKFHLVRKKLLKISVIDLKIKRSFRSYVYFFLIYQGFPGNAFRISGLKIRTRNRSKRSLRES